MKFIKKAFISILLHKIALLGGFVTMIMYLAKTFRV